MITSESRLFGSFGGSKSLFLQKLLWAANVLLTKRKRYYGTVALAACYIREELIKLHNTTVKGNIFFKETDVYN